MTQIEVLSSPAHAAELAALEEEKSVQDYCGAAERGGLRRSPSSMAPRLDSKSPPGGPRRPVRR
jgi:hypothetical protein